MQDGGKTGPVALGVGSGDAFTGPVQRETKRRAGAAGDVLALVLLDADAALCSSGKSLYFSGR